MSGLLKYKPIKSLRRIKRKCKVYNFDVPKYEAYIANGFVVHNCQNYKVSQSTAAKTRLLMPKDLVDLAEEKKANGIAFTYNEPTVHYEYLLEVGIQLVLRQSDLKMAVKTSGFASKHVLRDLSLFDTGFNVDIKGDDQEYQKTCGGTLGPVMEAIEWLVEIKSHLEISYLVLPRQVNDKKHHRKIRDWLSELDPNIPVHLLYFYPFHKMIEATYEMSALIEVLNIFRVKMKYVYISNTFSKQVLDHRNTKCKKCGEIMIERYRKTIVNKLECCGLKIKGLVI